MTTRTDIVQEMKAYRAMRQRVDEWFERSRRTEPERMVCNSGCDLCCHGLFDISVPDAVELTRGIATLGPDQRAEVGRRAVEIQAQIDDSPDAPGYPSLFQPEDESAIDRIVEHRTEVPCPLLTGDGRCQVYAFRPMACRVEGAPLVDTSEGLLTDWCELNFADGEDVDPARYRFDWRGVDDVDRAVSAAIAKTSGQNDLRAATTFIPSVVGAYERFWLPLVRVLLPDG